MSENELKSFDFFRIFVFHQNVSMDIKSQFWRPGNVFQSLSEMDTKTKSFLKKEIISSDYSYGHVKCSFDNPAEKNFFLESQKVPLVVRN